MKDKSCIGLIGCIVWVDFVDLFDLIGCFDRAYHND